MISRFIFAVFSTILFSLPASAEEAKSIDTGIIDEVYYIKTINQKDHQFEIVGLGRKSLSEAPSLIKTMAIDPNCAKFSSIVMEKPEVYSLIIEYGFVWGTHCGLIKNKHLDKHQPAS